MIGGYKIIDFKGYDFTPNTEVPYSEHGIDVYNRVESTTKRIVLHNLVCGGVEIGDIVCQFYVSEPMVARAYLGDYVAKISVTGENAITLSLTEPTEKLTYKEVNGGNK